MRPSAGQVMNRSARMKRVMLVVLCTVVVLVLGIGAVVGSAFAGKSPIVGAGKLNQSNRCPARARRDRAGGHAVSE